MSDNAKKFILAALTRAGHTAAQTALSTIGTTAVVFADVPWGVVISSALLAALISLLKSCAFGVPEAPKDGDGK